MQTKQALVGKIFLFNEERAKIFLMSRLDSTSALSKEWLGQTFLPLDQHHPKGARGQKSQAHLRVKGEKGSKFDRN